MRRVLAIFVATAGAAIPAGAQSWYTALGIHGGFTRFKVTGAPGGFNQIDVYGVPSTSILGAFPTTGGIFVILPVADKIALEPSFTFDQANGIVGVPATFASFSLRADYALTPRVYAALGLFGYYSTAGGAPRQNLQPGFEAAAGYRLHFSSSLEGRVEAQAITVKKTTNNRPFNTYSLLFGLSAPISGADGRPMRGTARAHGAWRPAIGLTGGYYQVHFNGGGDVTLLSFPGGGASHNVGIAAAPSTPSLFVMLPATDKLAIELGFDGQDIRAGPQTVASFTFAPRVDLAVGERWYAAAGPTLHLLRFANGAPSPTIGVAGLAVAWGVRFHIGGAVNGRVEANYGLTASRNQAPSITVHVPTGAFGITFGALLPLK